MKFTHYDIGSNERGTVVEVTLSGNAANVRLMDTSNYENYRNGRAHQYYGGLIKSSPASLVIPSSGHWHVTIDFQGLVGKTQSSIKIIPPSALVPLPEYSPQTLKSISEIVQQIPSNNFGTSIGSYNMPQYDVFISHATEDKEEVVQPLVSALITKGIQVWYDEFELRIGDSLRRKINAGLAQCRFGVVVLSHSFFKKNWPQYELDGLVTREMNNGQKIILPIWHRITKDEIMVYSPSLADKMALSTADISIKDIAQEISDVVQNKL